MTDERELARETMETPAEFDQVMAALAEFRATIGCEGRGASPVEEAPTIFQQVTAGAARRQQERQAILADLREHMDMLAEAIDHGQLKAPPLRCSGLRKAARRPPASS